MAATLFFPPPSIPHSNHISHHLPLEDDEEEDDSAIILTTHCHLHHQNTDIVTQGGSDGVNASPETSATHVHEQRGQEEEEEEEEEEDGEGPQGETHHPNPSNALVDEHRRPGTGVDLGTLIGRRVTLKPRRTLSLSPTPARSGDMMARNLKAARWLDFTNEDDDDGLYQPSSDSDSEGKRKPFTEEMCLGGIGKVRVTRRGGSLTLGAMGGLNRGEFLLPRRGSSSMKRPLEVTLPCQEIQYLDISYQKVGIHSVQFSPIPRKKIAYHPVPYHAIHYCDVPYIGQRPVKRKPPA